MIAPSRRLWPVLGLLFVFVAWPLVSLDGQQVDVSRLSGMEARSIGPAGMSGRIGSIEGVPGDPSTLYVGTATGGIWKSEDKGITWKPIFDDQTVASIGVITVHPANPDLVWVGTGEANLRNSSGVGRGVWKSMDGGETWQFVGLGDTEHIHRIAVHPTNPEIAYVAATGPLWKDGGQRGLYKTTDGGETWQRILEGPNPRTGAVEVVVDPRSPLKLFASLWEFRRWPYFFESGGPGSGLYVSHDGGKTWEEIDHEDGLPKGHLGRIGVDVAPSDPSRVYALVEARKNALYRSDDGGRSWQRVNDSEGIAPRPFYYGRLMVDPKDPNRVYNIGGTLRLSTDGGRSFEGVATWGGGVHVDHHALWIDPENPAFVVDGNDGGVYISHDRAGSWRFVENLPLSQFYELAVDRQVPYHVYGGLQDNGSWRGPSEVWERGGIRNYHWTEIGFGDGFGALADPEDPRYGFSMSQRGFLNRWDLETGERRNIRPAAPNDSVELRFNWNAPIALDPFRENTVYYGSQFVHRSTDDGLSWEVISPDLTTNNPEWQKQDESGGLTYDVTGAENYTNLYAIAPSPAERGVIWTGSDDGLIHVTRNGGRTWTDVTDNLPGEVPDNPWISHIEASPFDGGTAFAVIHNYMKGDWSTYVYRTTDYGDDWDRIAGEGVDGFARTLEQDPEVPELLYLGTEFGLWVTLDGGDSWFRWTHGMPAGVPVRALTIQPDEHDLVVGTHGRGVYILDDVRPLRAMARNPGVMERTVHLFPAGPTYQHTRGAPKVYRFDGDAMYSGENEPYGATFAYVTNVAPEEGQAEEEATEASPTAEPGGPPPAEDEEKEEKGPKATLEVLEADSVIRTVDEGLDADSGLHRYSWDLRREGFERPRGAGGGPPGAGDDRRTPGPEVLPGRYTLRLIAGGDTATRQVEVRSNPRTDVPMSERRAKFDALMRVGRLGESATEAVNRIRDTQKSVKRVLELAGDQGADLDSVARADLDSLKKAGEALRERLSKLEEEFVGEEVEGQGITGGEEGVMDDLGYAYFNLSSSKDAPTETQHTLMRRAEQRLAEAVEETNDLFDTEVADFRRQVEGAGLTFFEEWEPIEMP